MINLDDLPAELLPFKDNILATVKPVIEITLSPAQDLPLWASKVGGKPYLPLEVEYPHDDKGNPLLLLAQFNLAELPKTDLLPNEGILAFFLSNDEDFYGEVYNKPLKQSGFRVVYFDNVIEDNAQLQQDFHQFYKKVTPLEMFPIFGELENPSDIDKLQFKPIFSLNKQEIGYNNFDFNQVALSGKDFWQDVINGNDALFRELVDEKKLFSPQGHHLLGYPFFIHEDNRPFDEFTKDYILLFQLDSEVIGNFEILWGDTGVGNFFIHPDDLKNKDFSKVAFYWECC